MNNIICYILIITSSIAFSCSPSPLYKRSKLPAGKTQSEKVEKNSKTKTTDAEDSANKETEKPQPGTKYRGIASFYADQYHGRKTSNGEIFDMNGLTAAHNTLPFNTWVEVKNLSNGRTVIVRINDRGPFIDGRIIDLSYGAAKELHMIGKGLQEVEVTVLR